MYEIPLIVRETPNIFVLLNARCQISWLIGVVYEVALFSALETAAQARPGPRELISRCREAGQAAPEEVMSRWWLAQVTLYAWIFGQNRSNAGAMNGKLR
jgi:hypothetical protein